MTDPSECINKILVKQWSEEENNYVTALDADKKEIRTILNRICRWMLIHIL